MKMMGKHAIPKHFSEYLILCSAEETHTGLAWHEGEYIITFFGWTISLNADVPATKVSQKSIRCLIKNDHSN